MDRPTYRDHVAQLLAQKRDEIARTRAAKIDESRRASDARRREVSAMAEVLVQLSNFKKDLRGTARIGLKPIVHEGEIRAAAVLVGKWPAWLEKPYATFMVATMVNLDEEPASDDGKLVYVLVDVKSGSIDANSPSYCAITIDEIIKRISVAAAECIANYPGSPYRIPAWYTDTSGEFGALCGLGLWIYLAISWGWWGIFLGLIPAVAIGVAITWLWLPVFIAVAAWLFFR